MPRRFIILYFAATVAFSALLCLVNYVVDPYAINGRFSLFAEKPEVITHERIAKAFGMLRSRPREIILGTSRAEYALPLVHPGWRAPAGQRMNAAVAGATAYESSLFFAQAVTAGELQRALIGLDFFAFNGYRRTVPGLNESVFIKSASPWSGFTHALPFYLSIDTLRSSFITVRGSASQVIPTEGPSDDATFANEVHTRGQRFIFLRSEKYYLTSAFFPHPHGKFALRPPGLPSQLDDFARLVALARENHVELHLFISPVHARQLETIRAAGLWGEFELWKRELVRILAEDAAAHPGAPRQPLWDFSGYGTVQTEPVPPANDRSTIMRGYRESSHYEKLTGVWVLDRILGLPSGAPMDFGVILDATNLESHLLRLRDERGRWAARHADEVNEIEALAQAAGRKPQ